ncbi:MAG: hypothetical protein P4L33_03385 [Capsulimonadaceae bacterium]|nr:hypothetical protein [Capsulimonadaceae bacterium]
MLYSAYARRDPTATRSAIIDGHNFLWRSYSVPFSFASVKGTPLHVVATFLELVRRSVAAIPHLGWQDRLVVVFDGEGPSRNFQLSADYKANRRLGFADGEDSPFRHLPLIKSALEQLGIGYVELAGVEGDDVVASLSKRFQTRHPGGACYVFSSDTDFYQLVDDRTFIVNLRAKDCVDFVDTSFIREKFGIAPADYVFFKSLTGDATDNIRGVPGVGPKKARPSYLAKGRSRGSPTPTCSRSTNGSSGSTPISGSYRTLSGLSLPRRSSPCRTQSCSEPAASKSRLRHGAFHWRLTRHKIAAPDARHAWHLITAVSLPRCARPGCNPVLATGQVK